MLLTLLNRAILNSISGLAHQESTIDLDDFAGDLTAAFAAQEQNRTGKILGLAESA